jgi:DNA-binding CsgD family transcriptional regulator
MSKGGTMSAERAPAVADLELVERLAREIDALGREVGLPFIAVSADISSPRPMVGMDAKPLAETLFRWIDPTLEYWRDRAFALRAPFVFATRLTSEPFYFQDGRLQTWRPTGWTQAMGAIDPGDMFGVATAIVAPAYLPRGVIGAVVWASPDADVDVARTFATRASEFHLLALRLTGAYQEAALGARKDMARLTRREIQCLKWAAAGKTDGEIAAIVQIATPTVRFHMINAADKLGVAGRSQTVHRAATLGYIGAVGGA